MGISKGKKFGSGSYFCLFAGLHFEEFMLTIHGEIIKGNGLENISSNIDMSLIGTGSLFHANHIKQARYCLQVSLCAMLLKDTKDKSGLTLGLLEGLE